MRWLFAHLECNTDGYAATNDEACPSERSSFLACEGTPTGSGGQSGAVGAPGTPILTDTRCLLTAQSDVDSPIAGPREGAFACAQGVTGMRLQLASATGGLQAIWTFYPVDSNPGVPSGCWRAVGQFNSATGNLSIQDTLTGRVNYAGCTTFGVSRAVQ